MLDLLTVEDSLADKPSFRWLLEDHEKDITDLELILEKVSRGCKTFCETGRAFCDSMGPFTEGISDLANHFEADEEIRDAYKTFTEHLEEIKSFYSMLLEQTKCSILTSMIEVMKKSLKDVKAHRKAFKDKSVDLDTALHANSSKLIKRKDDEMDIPNSLSTLSTVKTSFHHTSVDYMYEVNKLQLEKQFIVTEKFLHLMYSFYSFFHQGYLTLQDIDPYLKNLNVLMQQKKTQCDEAIQEMDGRHKAITELKNNKYDGLMITPKDESVLLEGYLYKRSHNTFRSWKRRYFLIKTNQLHYQKRNKSNKEEENKIVSEDLRISQVRSTDEQDRRYCFELIMPNKKIFLQADSQKVKDAWIKSLQTGIEAAIHNTTSPKDSRLQSPNSSRQLDNRKSGNSEEILKLIDGIKRLPGNDICADCDSVEPVWASINLGVTLCIECSGIHRNLGVHISKVRSLDLDTWELEQCLLMLQLGNNRVSEIYEHSTTAVFTKPVGSQSINSLSDREVWIKAKYEEKLFLENRDYVTTTPRRHKSVCSYKSISYQMSGSANSSLKARSAKQNYGMRPLSKLFHRKKQTGSDGAAYIDTDPSEERAMSPQYALIGTEEPEEQLSDICVPDEMLSTDDHVTRGHVILTRDNKLVKGAPLSSSTPDLLELSNKDVDSNVAEDVALVTNLNLIGPLALNNSLYEASKSGHVITMFRYIIEGANINYHNSTDHDKTPLIQAVHSKSSEAVQLLLVNGAGINECDDEGQGPLHYAALQGNTQLACLLVRRGADHLLKDYQNKDALDIAVSREKASLVTVLRFLRINDTLDPASQQMLTEFSKKRPQSNESGSDR